MSQTLTSKAPGRNEAGLREIMHFVNGDPVAGRSGRFGAIYNPAQGVQTARVPLADASEVQAALDAAQAAFPAWAETTPLQRARVMFRFKEQIESHMDELARIVSSEHGKLLEDARGSVQRGLEVVEFACAMPHLLKGEFSENVSRGVDSFSVRQPLGVCVGITPFNFPAMVPLWMAPIAIGCGNTFILKPSERDPSTAVRLAELFAAAGGPPGVFNVLHGDREAVEMLLRAPEVAAVSFVGSTPIARSIYETAAAQGKRVQALGGAKNHAIVMPDADLEQACSALIGAAYGSAGERCMAISACVAVGDAAEPLIEKLAARAANLRIGPAEAEAMEMGPLVTREHRARVIDYIATGVAEGAQLVVDGRACEVPGCEAGFFLGGSLFDHVTPEMRVWQEEIFGPVLSVLRVPDLESAIALVNSHPYANGAAIFTSEGSHARTFAHRIAAGMVGINVPIPVPMAFHSFGGAKQSFFGDHAVHGMEGVRFYTRLKTITSRWPDSAGLGHGFMMPVAR